MTSPMHDHEPERTASGLERRTNGQPPDDWADRFYAGIEDYERTRARRIRLAAALITATAVLAVVLVLL